MKRPSLAVVTIHRGDPAPLIKTLDSLQSCRIDQLIVVISDCPNEDAQRERIAHDFSNSRMISEAPRGIYHAMNSGLRHVDCDFVQFINSGDEAIAENLNRALECLDFSKDVILHNALISYGDGSEVLWRAKLFGRRRLWQISGPHLGFIYRSQVIKPIGYSETFRLAGDWQLDAWLRVEGAEYALSCLDEPVGRFHSGGASAQMRSKSDFEKVRWLFANEHFGAAVACLADAQINNVKNRLSGRVPGPLLAWYRNRRYS